MGFVSILSSLLWLIPASAWSNFVSRRNVDSVNCNVVQVVTDSAAHWPIDPICGFVAATNIAVLYPPPQWSCNASGSPDSDSCTWDGIICDHQSETIVSIIQGGLSLTGTLAPLLGNISTLESISIYQTRISGTLPSSWSSLAKMTTLDLYQNYLSGTLPSSWSSLTAMNTLDLYQNSLSGPLPSSWSSLTAMTALVLNQNSLSGPLPSSWSSLTAINTLDLDQNYLSGTLPFSWSSLAKMIFLFMNQNSVSGPLPSSWSSLAKMNTLDLHQNSLSSTLPFSWSSLAKMNALNLHQNYLFGTLPSSWSSLTAMKYLSLAQNSLSGTLPSSWRSLTRMTVLYLYQNSLSGTLPSSWSSLTKINYLDLHQNSLSGTLPSLWSSLRAMINLDLYQNSLVGPMASSWSSLTEIIDLALGQNSLSGTLPSSWSSLTRMTALYLSQNSLSGTLPSSWSSLTRIADLAMNQNSLSGPLPSSWSSLTGIADLFMNQNSLSGTLPSSWSSLAVMNTLNLYQNSLSGTLPSSWSSLTAMTALFLYQNSLSGPLPSSWSSLARMRYLDLGQNSLSGALPSSFGSLKLVSWLYLDDNSFTGSVPISWSSLTDINDLSLSGNHLTGTIPLCLNSMSHLQYLYISENSFNGSLPFTWASNLIRTINMSNNAFSGSLHTDVSSYPAALRWLDVACNSLDGTLPASVALSGKISYLNVSHNDGIVGSIPSEFCSSQGVSIDVTGTGIECYSGCLTSSFILVTGASPECHDGSIMERFVIISGVLATVAVVCTAVYRHYDWWSPFFVTLGSKMSCGFLNIFGHIFSWLRYMIFGSSIAADGAGRNVSTAADGKTISYTVFGMAVAKFLLGLVVSLTLNNWWTYSGGRSMARNNEVLASCSNPTVGNCFSYCGDVHVVSVNITTDDVVFDDVYGTPVLHPIADFQNDSYCTAMLPGYCGYEVWMDLKLPPIVLHLLGLLLQIMLWRFGSDGFSVTPQKAQYDLIVDQLYPQLDLSSTNKRALQPEITLALRVSLLNQLTTPLFPTIFWFLELVTVLYVFGELVFPPVYCGSVPPLSLYYYPILMSLLDLMKLNIYISVELWKTKRHVESVLVLFNLQLFVTHLWVTVAMGLIFGAGVIRDCVLGVWWYIEIVMGRRQKLEWATENKSAAIEMVQSAGTSNSNTTSNPMLLVTPDDVESAATT